jgi:hypothetical protein
VAARAAGAPSTRSSTTRSHSDAVGVRKKKSPAAEVPAGLKNRLAKRRLL